MNNPSHTVQFQVLAADGVVEAEGACTPRFFDDFLRATKLQSWSRFGDHGWQVTQYVVNTLDNPE